MLTRFEKRKIQEIDQLNNAFQTLSLTTHPFILHTSIHPSLIYPFFLSIHPPLTFHLPVIYPLVFHPSIIYSSIHILFIHLVFIFSFLFFPSSHFFLCTSSTQSFLFYSSFSSTYLLSLIHPTLNHPAYTSTLSLHPSIFLPFIHLIINLFSSFFSVLHLPIFSSVFFFLIHSCTHPFFFNYPFIYFTLICTAIHLTFIQSFIYRSSIQSSICLSVI